MCALIVRMIRILMLTACAGALVGCALVAAPIHLAATAVNAGVGVVGQTAESGAKAVAGAGRTIGNAISGEDDEEKTDAERIGDEAVARGKLANSDNDGEYPSEGAVETTRRSGSGGGGGSLSGMQARSYVLPEGKARMPGSNRIVDESQVDDTPGASTTTIVPGQNPANPSEREVQSGFGGPRGNRGLGTEARESGQEFQF